MLDFQALPKQIKKEENERTKIKLQVKPFQNGHLIVFEYFYCQSR